MIDIVEDAGHGEILRTGGTELGAIDAEGGGDGTGHVPTYFESFVVKIGFLEVADNVDDFTDDRR